MDIHSYKAVGLQPDTSYHFSVIAVGRDGKELGSAASLEWKTTPIPQVFPITEYGAKPSGKGLFIYNETSNRLTEANTRAIQAAIDACTAGGKVVIPEGIWMTGALYLHSDMTL